MEFPGLLIYTSIRNVRMNTKSRFKLECLNINAYVQSFVIYNVGSFILTFNFEQISARHRTEALAGNRTGHRTGEQMAADWGLSNPNL